MPRTGHRRLLLATLALLMAAATPAVAQSDKPCDVMDDATVSAAFGAAAWRDRNPQSLLPGLCEWRSKGVAGDGLTIQVDDGGQDKYDFDRAKLPVNDIAGVGDAAFAFVSPAGFVQLGMMKGGIYVAIILQVQNAPDVLDRAEALARAIAGRM